MDAVPGERFGRGPALLIAVATATTAVLLSHDLGARPLWLDETVSAVAAVSGPREIVAMFRTYDGNMLLYHLVLWAWTRIAGDGEAAIRSLSAICAVVTIPVVGLVGRRLVGAWPGALGAAVLAGNRFFVGYGREGRAYALEVLLVSAAILALERARTEDDRRAWLAWAILAGLAPYTHLFAVLPLAVHALAVLVDRTVDRRRLLVWGAVVTALVLPLLLNTLALGSGQIAWIPIPGWRMLGRLARGIAGGDTPWSWTIHVAAWLAGAATAWRAGGRGVRVVCAWAVLPIAIAFAFSRLVTPAFVPRYLLMTSPAWALLAGAGLARVRFPVAALAVWILIVQPWDDPRARPPWTENWHAAITWFSQEAAQPGDAVIPLAHFADVPFGYHLRHVAPGLRLDVERATGAPVTVGGWQVPADPAVVGRIAATHARIWLLLHHLDVPGSAEALPGLQQAVERTHELFQQGDFAGVQFRGYRRRTPPAAAP